MQTRALRTTLGKTRMTSNVREEYKVENRGRLQKLRVTEGPRGIIKTTGKEMIATEGMERNFQR